MNIAPYKSSNIKCQTKLLLLLLLGHLLLSGPVKCQPDHLTFEHLTFLNGLHTGIISNIYQDKKGCIWLGSYAGLIQYDGYEFKVFNPVLNDPYSISGPYANAMAEDNKGRFWVGTNFGLNVYDRSSGKFYHFLNDPHNRYSLNNNYIRDILYDETSDQLWVGTASGLHALDLKNIDITRPDKAKFKRFLWNPDDTSTIDNNLIRDIKKDKNNRLYVLTNGSYLNLFNKERNRVQRIYLGDKVNNTYKMSVVDKNNVVWISTVLGYLIRCNLNTNNIQLLEPLKKIGASACPLRRLLAIEDRLWISTEGAGLLILNTKTGQITTYTSNPLNYYSLNSDKLLAILQDRSGVIWIGTNGSGVNVCVPNRARFGHYFPDGKDGLSGKVIRAILNGNNRYVWIGTDGNGLDRLDRSAGTFRHYVNDPKNPNSLSSNRIFSLFEDHSGYIWIGTSSGGLNKFDPLSNKFISYIDDPISLYSLKNEEVRCIIEDKKNNLWLGTSYTGLIIFNPLTGRFYSYTNISSNSGSISANRVNTLLTDKDNNLFIGTSSGAYMVDLNKVDYSSYSPGIVIKHLEFVNPNYEISSIYMDSHNDIWFCTSGGGLIKWIKSTGKAITYTVRNGLSSDIVTGILEDNDKKMWISGKNGLSKYDPVANTFKNYDASDGLQSPEFFSGCCKTSDGELVFGGVNGLNAFYPRELKINNHKPTILLTDLKIFNQPVNIGEKVNDRIILKQALSESKEIELSYKENYFSISFVALDYVNPHKNMYAFQMQGLEDKWIQLGNKHEATFSDLDPKEYIFRVRASNSDGVWNEDGVFLKIIIRPPWWQTWWFKLILLSIFVTSVYLAYYLRVALYRKKQKELSLLVKQRTFEISQANDVLLERQARIEEYTEELRAHAENLREANGLLMEKQDVIESQSVQLKETNEQLLVLNSTKDKFFSIIAHDLRNPFHTVSGFSEVLLKDLDVLPSNKIRRFLELIHASSTSGSDLLENLLLWSRSQTGRISFDPDKTNLLAIVQETLDLLEGDLNKKNLNIRILVEPDIFVTADTNMLKTIFRNLISNAIKFSYEHGVITVETRIINNTVEITVTDQGVGIPFDSQTKLFRVDTTVSTRGTAHETGTGLGLLLCKEFVEKHNGKIWVESEEDKGSAFKFTLPMG